MTRSVVTLEQGQSVLLAQALVREKRIVHLPIVDERGRFVGMVSQMALLTAHARLIENMGSAQDEAELTIPVSHVMDTDAKWVAPETLAADALELMLREKVGALPVLQNGRVVGIVSRRDFLAFELVALRAVVERSCPEARRSVAKPTPAPTEPAPQRAARRRWRPALAVAATVALGALAVGMRAELGDERPPTAAQGSGEQPESSAVVVVALPDELATRVKRAPTVARPREAAPPLRLTSGTPAGQPAARAAAPATAPVATRSFAAPAAERASAVAEPTRGAPAGVPPAAEPDRASADPPRDRGDRAAAASTTRGEKVWVPEPLPYDLRPAR